MTDTVTRIETGKKWGFPLLGPVFTRVVGWERKDRTPCDMRDAEVAVLYDGGVRLDLRDGMIVTIISNGETRHEEIRLHDRPGPKKRGRRRNQDVIETAEDHKSEGEHQFGELLG